MLVATIILLSIVPAQDRPKTGVPGHYEHLFAYFVTAFVLAIGYSDRAARVRLAVFMVVLSGALELLQLWIPGRHSELIGFLGSSSGAALGMIVASFVPAAH
jgi:VanZ family protein